MDQVTLTVSPRTALGKGAVGRLRKEGFIPAVIYGHAEPENVSVNAREFYNNFKHVSENTIITLNGLKSEKNVLVKDFHEDILADTVLHIDFYEIEKGKALKTHVPVKTTGTCKAVKEGAILEVQVHEVEVECLPKDLPETIEVDITELVAGHAIHVRDLVLPKGVKVLNADDQTVVHVGHAKSAAADTAAEGTEEASEEA